MLGGCFDLWKFVKHSKIESYLIVAFFFEFSGLYTATSELILKLTSIALETVLKNDKIKNLKDMIWIFYLGKNSSSLLSLASSSFISSQ